MRVFKRYGGSNCTTQFKHQPKKTGESSINHSLLFRKWICSSPYIIFLLKLFFVPSLSRSIHFSMVRAVVTSVAFSRMKKHKKANTEYTNDHDKWFWGRLLYTRFKWKKKKWKQKIMKNGITKPKILRKPKNKSIKIINGLIFKWMECTVYTDRGKNGRFTKPEKNE